MGTGYTRNDTSNNIATGKIANASDIDGEFDAIQSAFDSISGHTHDGTSAEGGPISVVGPSQNLIVSASSVLPKTDSTLDLGNETYRFKSFATDAIRIAGGQEISLLTPWVSFTAEFRDETGNASAVTTTGRWMRIGSLVFVHYNFANNITSVGMVGDEFISLELPPVTPRSGSWFTMPAFLSHTNYDNRNGGMIGRIESGGNLRFVMYDADASLSPGSYTPVKWQDITSGTTDFSGGNLFYEAD